MKNLANDKTKTKKANEVLKKLKNKKLADSFEKSMSSMGKSKKGK